MFLVIIILVLIFIREAITPIREPASKIGLRPCFTNGKIKAIVLVLTSALAITKFFFKPKYKPLPFCTTFISSSVFANYIKSGVADKAALGFLDAAALLILLAISNALTGLLATFFPKLTVALPILLKKPFNPSAPIVASLTVIDLFFLHLTQLPFNILVSFEAKNLLCY